MSINRWHCSQSRQRPPTWMADEHNLGTNRERKAFWQALGLIEDSSKAKRVYRQKNPETGEWERGE